MLKEYDNIEDDVVLIDTELGRYTQVQAHSELEDVTFGDYTYCAGYNQIFAADIGKFFCAHQSRQSSNLYPSGTASFYLSPETVWLRKR